jgi:hypothetical protein
MHIDLQVLKQYSDSRNQFENLVNEFCIEPTNKESIAYQTLNNLNFIKSDGFDLDVIEQYDSSFLTVVLTKVINDFIWLINSNDDDFSYEELESISEEEYMEAIDKMETSNSILDENSVYYKTLKNNKILTKKANKFTFNSTKLQELDVESLNFFVNESVSMVSTEDLDYNEIVTEALKKMKILK